MTWVGNVTGKKKSAGMAGFMQYNIQPKERY
jgi:hypothetical protein